MKFVELKMYNNSFSGIIDLDLILSIKPYVEVKEEFKFTELPDGRKIQSFCIPNNLNSDIKYYSVNFKNGTCLQISVKEYEILKYKIRKLQGGLL